MQLQFKIPLILSRILREDAALTGDTYVVGCIWQMFCNSLSWCHFSADMLLLHLDGTVSGRGKRTAFQMCLLFWAIGGCCKRRNVLDCSCSFVVPADCQAVGANGLWNAGNICWSAEESCAIQRSWWAASASTVVLAYPWRIFKWGESPFHEVCVRKISIASQHSWYLSEIPNNEGW